MKRSRKADTPQPPAGGVNRRQFLTQAALLGLSASSVAVFLQACSKLDSTKTPISTRVSVKPTPSGGIIREISEDMSRGYVPPNSVVLDMPDNGTMMGGSLSSSGIDHPENLTTTLKPRAALAPTPESIQYPTLVPSPPRSATAVVTPTATPFSKPTPSTPPSRSPKRQQMAYLLRRAGFGADPQDLDKFESMGYEATVDYLLEYEQVDDTALDTMLLSTTFDMTKAQDIKRKWALRMLYTKRPLQERMVLFWHGLLVSATHKVNNLSLLQAQNDLFRAHVLDTYDVILKAITRDPAMLFYLDNRLNRRGAPNENYARELMELFSLGVGNYTEADVRESARAFTGYGLDKEGIAFEYHPAQHDAGVKTFLGKQGNFDADDIVNLILFQPAAHEFIVRKLFSFFVYRNPEPHVVIRLARIFRDSRYSIKAVMRDILLGPEIKSPKAYRGTVKSPVDVVVTTMRTMGLQTDGSNIDGFMTRMNQTLFNPPNVAGWPGGNAWISSNTLLERLNFVNRIASAKGSVTVFTPSANNKQQVTESLYKSLDFYAQVLLDGNVPEDDWQILRNYASLIAELYTGKASTEGMQRSLVYLLMALPDYQLV
ncbi:MAG: DUF1800 family protein [Dehalococcoidia bacterium]|nr:DUF1800 family protein [Dehalococcoidia bacterium]